MRPRLICIMCGEEITSDEEYRDFGAGIPGEEGQFVHEEGIANYYGESIYD